MPSAQVIDLSPRKNPALVKFGEGFGQAMNEQAVQERDEDILAGLYQGKGTEGEEDYDPIQKLEQLQQRKGLSPQRRKEERENLFAQAKHFEGQETKRREEKEESKEKMLF